MLTHLSDILEKVVIKRMYSFCIQKYLLYVVNVLDSVKKIDSVKFVLMRES